MSLLYDPTEWWVSIFSFQSRIVNSESVNIIKLNESVCRERYVLSFVEYTLTQCRAFKYTVNLMLKIRVPSTVNTKSYLNDGLYISWSAVFYMN